MSTEIRPAEAADEALPVASTSNGRLATIWNKLSRNQRRFVLELPRQPSRAKAAEAIGLKPETVYRWPDYVIEAAELIEQDAQRAALEILSGGVAEVAAGKLEETRSEDEKLASAARTEILDRVLGKPTTRSEVKMDAQHRVASVSLDDALASLVRPSRFCPDCGSEECLCD